MKNNDKDILHFEMRSAAAQSSEEMIVEGHAAVYGKETFLYTDYLGRDVYEEIAPGAFDDCDISNVVMFYDHSGKIVARTANETLVVTPDETGLHMLAKLDGTEAGRELYAEIKGKYITSASFSFDIASSEENIIQNGDKVELHRKILKFEKIYDVSAVAFPAYEDAYISARSKKSAEAEKRQKQIKKITILTEV